LSPTAASSTRPSRLPSRRAATRKERGGPCGGRLLFHRRAARKTPCDCEERSDEPTSPIGARSPRRRCAAPRDDDSLFLGHCEERSDEAIPTPTAAIATRPEGSEGSRRAAKSMPPAPEPRPSLVGRLPSAALMGEVHGRIDAEDRGRGRPRYMQHHAPQGTPHRARSRRDCFVARTACGRRGLLAMTRLVEACKRLHSTF